MVLARPQKSIPLWRKMSMDYFSQGSANEPIIVSSHLVMDIGIMDRKTKVFPSKQK